MFSLVFCLTLHFISFLCSRRFLRLFSSGGNQGQVIWLDGEPVTMVGRSRFLAVFYHESTPLPDGTQKLGYLLFDGMANRTVAKGTVSGISKGSSLSWAGFSNDGSLLATDTDGMVSMLVSSATQDTDSILGSWEWMPMLDTVGLRKSADDSYWPITMYDAKLICVPLKGGTKHPDAARRPVTAALGLRVPLARGTLTKCNALEELAVRAGIALGQKKVMHDIASEGQVDEDFEREYTALSAQVVRLVVAVSLFLSPWDHSNPRHFLCCFAFPQDKVTLKMFASTVEAGKLERSLDLVERLHLEKSLDLAMTIADSHRKLVDLIEDVKDRKFGPPCEQEAGYDEPEYTDQHYDGEEDALQRITPDANQARKAKRSFEDEPMEGSREVRRKPAFA
jgi:chromosome transmission fidelity protein 4